MVQVDFWYSIGSTYSYLSVMRLDQVARSQKVRFRWRPFNVRHVMVTQKNIPFKDKPTKTAYMWRDIERRSNRYGLSPTLPAPYPLPELVGANQIAVLGVREGWVADYTRETYRLWFERSLPAGEAPNLTQALRAIGQDPTRVLAAATAPEIEAELRRETEEAMARGVFGSPSFVVGGEVFWGDDRLDDAIE